MDWQQINIQNRNIQAEVHNRQEQNIQENQRQNLMEQNMQEVPVQNLQEIQEHVNEAAGALEWENNHVQLPPQAVPHPPVAQEAAAMNKQEKRMLKIQQREEMRRRQEEERQRQEEERRRREEERQRQEEERRRQREEEARILREAREELLRREEEKRQEKRKLLFEDDITLHAMEEMAQEVDETFLKEKMQQFLKTAARRLLELRPELKEDYQRTVDYVPVAESLRLIALEHGANDEQLRLAENAKQQMEALGELNQENVLMRVVQFELADIFKEEYVALSGLEKASNAMMEQYQERDQRQLSQLEDLGQQVAEAFHVKSEDGQKVNILKKGSPFAYLGKKEELEKYHLQVQEVKKLRKISQEEAEKRVIKNRRIILQQNALRKTRQGSVVQNVSVEDWKQYGGASFHHTLPAGEALKTVEKSNGYLYAEDVGNGLMELHHTLPETIELNIEGLKKKYPLRKNYNLFVKCIVTQLIDENGNMYQDKAHVNQMWNLYDQLFSVSSRGKVDGALADVLREGMKLIFKDENRATTEAINLHEFLKNLRGVSGTENFILGTEIVKNLGNFITMFGAAGDTSYNVRLERKRKEMLSDPNRTNTPEEIEEILKQIPNQSLEEQKARLVKVMESENCSPEMITQYVNALISFHADMDAAAMDLLDVRNMDINSKDVPLPNACSANALFYDNLSQIRNKKMGVLQYDTESHVKEYARENLAFILANPQKFAKFEAKEEELRRLAQQCLDTNYQVTEDEKKIIYEVASAMHKYDYHQAAKIGEFADGTKITCETFAAETTQAMVSPFIRRAAIGQYKGRVQDKHDMMANNQKEMYGVETKSSEGMTHYYNRDNPFSNPDDIRTELKEIFLKHGIAGVEQRVKEKQKMKKQK